MKIGEQAAAETVDFLRDAAARSRMRITRLEKALAHERELLRGAQEVMSGLEQVLSLHRQLEPLDSLVELDDNPDPAPEDANALTLPPKRPAEMPEIDASIVEIEETPPRRRQPSTQLVVQVLDNAMRQMTKDEVVVEMQALGYAARNVDNAVNTALLRARRQGRIDRDEETGNYSSVKLAAANPGDGNRLAVEAGE